jgi:tetratricopeptide (TPR) repeat protein/DNA-binding CsgD family transcriptional regulator
MVVILVAALVAACNTSVEPMERPCQELEEIDTLMWQQPDSALKVMLEFAESGRADSLDEFDGHYCQLLISELLYKNNYAQTNREDLLKAVDYFDSIDDGFLAARAHYINGVGYVEKDSVVEACTEYLKTLKIMETHLRPNHFHRFMTLTYSRIGELFASQFMQEPAIACFKKSLAFDNIEPCSPNNRSCLLLFIGKQYYKLSQSDSAEYYFDEALRQLHDTNNAVFRDLVSYKALLDYDIHHHVEAPINDLKRMIAQATDENELLARYTTLGVIYSLEGQYDSALLYLTSVYENNNDVVRQRAVSPYLRTIYQNLGDSLKADQYAVFIADNELSEGENKARVSILNELYQQHLQWEQDRAKAEERQRAARHSRWIWMAIAGLLLLVAIAIVVTRRGYGKRLKLQQEESDKQLKIQQEESSKQLVAVQDALKAKEQDALLTKVTAIYQDKLGNKTKRIFEAFSEAHPDAVAKLKTSYPDLTDTEVDICVLSHFAFRVKEIADILELRENTVAKYRSSIKKKAQIGDVESLMNQVL